MEDEIIETYVERHAALPELATLLRWRVEEPECAEAAEAVMRRYAEDFATMPYEWFRAPVLAAAASKQQQAVRTWWRRTEEGGK